MRSNPIAQLINVAAATATSTPGHFGRSFLMASMTASAASAIASVGKWVSPTCCITPQISRMKLSLRDDATPSMLLTCDSAMMIAAALVKPTMTGCDRKLTIEPSLNTPMASSNTPTISVSTTASTM